MKYDEVSPEAIEEALIDLSPTYIRLLNLIYSSPGSMMNAKELEKNSNRKRIHVGNAGKQLGKLCGVDDFGSHKEGSKFKVSYYRMIGEYYEDFGWVMNHNLRMAIKKYRKNRG